MRSVLLPLLALLACGPQPGDDTTAGSSSTMEPPTTGGATSETGCTPPVEGDLWAPCTDDHRCDGDEDGNVGCMYVVDPMKPQGSLCAPLCSRQGCTQADETNWCGEALGTPTCEPTTACGLPCEDDSDCGPALACFGKRCLWPEG